MSGKYLMARDAFGRGELSWTSDAIVAQLLSADYRFDEEHASANDLTGEVGDAVAVTGRDTDGGWARCKALMFRQVRGKTAVAVVFYRESDGMLIEYSDSIDSFPMTPNGGDIELEVREPGIFRI